jgi:predicted amidophosphoribosyltransferase
MPLLDLILPPRCLSCEAYLGPRSAPSSWCALCRPGLFVLSGPGCLCCGARRSAFPDQEATGVDDLCRDCLAEAPTFVRAASAWEYDGVMSELLPRIKYGGALEKIAPLARELRPWMLAQLDGLVTEPGHLRVIPVPLHPADLRRRGFNLTSLLARQALRSTPYRIFDEGLRKVARTRAQASLSGMERRQNLHDAFVAAAPGVSTIAVVFDDVMTSGTTAREAARALTKAGWSEVHVLTACRAI